MGLRFNPRRVIPAGAAAAVALGSAAAYAISLPELPVKLPRVELDVPVDLPQPLIPPPDIQLPSPIVGPPDGDELPDLGSVLDELDEIDEIDDSEDGEDLGKPSAHPEPGKKQSGGRVVKVEVDIPDWRQFVPSLDGIDWEHPDGADVDPGDGVDPGSGETIETIEVVVDTGSDDGITFEQRRPSPAARRG